MMKIGESNNRVHMLIIDEVPINIMPIDLVNLFLRKWPSKCKQDPRSYSTTTKKFPIYD